MYKLYHPSNILLIETSLNFYERITNGRVLSNANRRSIKENLNNLDNFFIFRKNLVKCLVTYLTKCIADAILKTISIKQKIVNFKKHLRIVLLTSKTLFYHQYSADFTHFVPLSRELFLHYWLTFRENG